MHPLSLRITVERTTRHVTRLRAEGDSELLRRCSSNDEEAWRLLVSRYQNLVWSVALDVGLENEDAADVFQEVWLELHRSIPRIRNPAALPRWLMVATRRLSYKVAARRRRMLPELSLDLIDEAALPDEELERVESRRRIEEALEALGGRCEDLIRLLFLVPDRPSYDEVSERLGMAVGSIGPIRSRCLGRLRSILEDVR